MIDVVITLAFLAQAAPPPSTLDLEDAVKRFIAVYAKVEEEAADRIDASTVIYGGALPAMLRGLDPHSIFLDPDQYQQLKEMTASESKGFGSIVSILPGRVFVLQTLPGTPSARAGLSPGDEIVAVNNIPLMGLEPDQLVGLLSESRRRAAKVSVRRQNTPRMLEFVLTPETVATSSVDRHFHLSPGVGYIRVASFEAKTAREFRDVIEKLGGTSLTGLVIDLRNNPGGVVEGAIEIAAMFLKPGDRILSVRGRAKKDEDVTVPASSKPYEMPVSILINEKTASASELVAAALQDHKRAKLIGTRSFGKGLVQSVYPLSSSTGMALTVAFYFSPNGRNIQRPLKDVQLASETPSTGRGGVEPDATVLFEPFSRLRSVLDASGYITTFATEALRKGLKVEHGFTAPDTLFDEFRVWLSERRVQPSVAEWSRDLQWTRSRLTQELLNQAVGVEAGDEVEMGRDVQVRRAVDLLGLQ